jgi:phage pi2 protein 07
MKKLLSFILISTLSLFVFAQNEKIISDKNAQSRNVKGFHGIRVSSGIDLYLTQGNEEAVAISATDQGVRERIKTEVENGVLKIYINNNGFHWSMHDMKMKAYVSFKNLDELGASGGSDIYPQSKLKVSKLDIRLSGGSDLKDADVDVQEMYIDQSGGSDVKISGQVQNLKVEASGGSDLHGYELTTDICNIRASGGSDARITVNKELNIDASGGSDIYYKGSGVIKELRTSGSSSISKKG